MHAIFLTFLLALLFVSSLIFPETLGLISLGDNLIFRRLLLLYASPHQEARVGQRETQGTELAVPKPKCKQVYTLVYTM